MFNQPFLLIQCTLIISYHHDFWLPSSPQRGMGFPWIPVPSNAAPPRQVLRQGRGRLQRPQQRQRARAQATQWMLQTWEDRWGAKGEGRLGLDLDGLQWMCPVLKDDCCACCCSFFFNVFLFHRFFDVRFGSCFFLCPPPVFWVLIGELMGPGGSCNDVFLMGFVGIFPLMGFVGIFPWRSCRKG